MAIDGFSYTVIVSGRTDPDSPLDTTLFVDITDNLEFLKLWLGKSFIGAAVADHDHDGVNSAQIDSGDLTGAAIDNGFVWIDSGTNVGLTSGVKDISSIVPVDTVFVQVYIRYDVTSGSTATIDAGEVSGTLREIARNRSTNPTSPQHYAALSLLPVDSSRQIEIAVTGTIADGFLEIRSNQK